MTVSTPVVQSVDTPTDALPLALLRDEVGIDRQVADPAGVSRLLPPMVALVVLGFVSHGACIAGMYAASLGPEAAIWLGTRWALAATGGFFAAICAGLPSYWFYGVVAKIRAPSWRLAFELVRVQAVGSVMLAGILPFWLAVVLGLQAIAGVDLLENGAWLVITFTLPFLSSLPGMVGLKRGFTRMREHLGEGSSWAPLVLTAWWGLLFATTAPISVWALFMVLS